MPKCFPSVDFTSIFFNNQQRLIEETCPCEALSFTLIFSMCCLRKVMVLLSLTLEILQEEKELQRRVNILLQSIQ